MATEEEVQALKAEVSRLRESVDKFVEVAGVGGALASKLETMNGTLAQWITRMADIQKTVDRVVIPVEVTNQLIVELRKLHAELLEYNSDSSRATRSKKRKK